MLQVRIMVNVAFALCLSIATVRKTRPKMASDEVFKHIIVKEIHQTFAAEVRGIDFSSPIAGDVFAEILSAMSKVRLFRMFIRILPCVTNGNH